MLAPGFTAELLAENQAMLYVSEKKGFDIKKRIGENVYELNIIL